MNDFAWIVAATVLAATIIGGWHFFVDMPGLSILRTRRYVRKLSAKIDPMTALAGATTATRWNYERGQFFFDVLFPDGSGFVIHGWLDAFNISGAASPKPGSKYLERYAILLDAVESLRKEHVAASEGMPR